ncbi:MAG: potassium/proton antiporter [Thermoleophilia bacterium]|nr:potassium/proton antiporter [Thermoleophilia bacterium]
MLAALCVSQLRQAATFDRVANLGSVALVLILFEGGAANGGFRRMRAHLRPILLLGLPGTVATAGLLAALCFYVVGLDAQTSVLLGVALAPTDPAAVFSVLGTQRLAGGADAIHEGESGANDPVGISLMLGAIAWYQVHESMGAVLGHVALQLLAGAAIGAAAGAAVVATSRRMTAIRGSAQLLLLAVVVFVTYVVAVRIGGSGFLAVFVLGLLVGSTPAAFRVPSERGFAAASAAAELAMFVALGLTADIASLGRNAWVGLAVFAMLTLAVRPAVVAAATYRSPHEMRARAFIAWGGLKGAVPMLLATLAATHGIESAQRLYSVVFVAVAASIAIQGATLPVFARRLGLVASESQ